MLVLNSKKHYFISFFVSVANLIFVARLGRISSYLSQYPRQRNIVPWSARSKFRIQQLFWGVMSTQSSVSSLSWIPLTPNNFESGPVSSQGCRLAKDQKYLEAVLTQWKQGQSTEDDLPIETATFRYFDSQKSPLHGHLVRPTQTSSDSKERPGVLLFHTAAGPQDVFLFHKAYVLAKELDCVVLICDIFSDFNGWAWGSDRTHYNQVRSDLEQDDYRLLRFRVEAAIRALIGSNAALNVDSLRLAMLGWCLGGQAILEFPRAEEMISGIDFSVRVLATFHGVFRRETQLMLPANMKRQDQKVIICNGSDDPFVTKEDVDSAKAYFESAGYKVEIATMKDARHGFSNPAQAFNNNDSFDYNELAAETSWARTMRVLIDSLS
ncbi:dienelactone hydrolase [Nitzschia inconspicua]|uniref:Dienelactone hydrolase n=1 Tax=Nitzschia inconspicua TaxID=303405 RepID=A0A9K3PXE7_9STRA|nr:dienelactone hydrolase [Nitzschia inconspicua]